MNFKILVYVLFITISSTNQQNTTQVLTQATNKTSVNTTKYENNTIAKENENNTSSSVRTTTSTITTRSAGSTRTKNSKHSAKEVPWQKKELSIATIVPHKKDDGGCVYHSIKMAIEDMNKIDKFITFEGNNTNLTFVRYDFKMVPYFGEVGNKIPDAINTLHNTYKGKIKIATIGPPYKDLTNNFVEYSSVLGNTHISYVEANEPLQQFYVFFLQSTPSINSQFTAAAAFLNHFNWRRAGIVYDFSDLKYRKNAGNLRETISQKIKNKKQSEILTEQGIWSELIDPNNLSFKMNVLQSSGSRIILSLVSIAGARKVFCEAFYRKMYKPKVVWILFETLPEGWASDKFNEKVGDGARREVTCTEDELLTAADGYISIIKQGLRIDNKRTISNMTADDFRLRLKKAVGKDVECDENVAYAYDALWVLGKGYQGLSKKQDLTTYYPHFYLFGYWFANEMFSLNFEALTGPLKYETAGRYIFKRIGEISFWVHRKHKKPQLIGVHKTALGYLQMFPNAQKILFDSNEIPRDQAKIVKQYTLFHKNLYITLWSVAFVGIIIASAFLVIAILYANDKHNSTKLESPLLNCTITLGSILCYVSVVIYGLDTRYVTKKFIPNVCFIFLCTLSIGFTLTFGGLFTKTWRLYKTFMTPSVANNKPGETKHIPEWILIIMIGVFLLIDAIVLVSWGVWTPFFTEIQNATMSENLFADIIVVEQTVRCNCDYFTHLLIGVCCYKGVLLLFGIFLAWQTKNARIQVQNESRQVALAIYNVVAVSVIGVICALVLLRTTKYEALYAIVSVCVFICTTFTLLLVFIPKLRRLLYPTSFNETDRTNSKEDMRNGIYLRKSKRVNSSNRLSTEMSSSFSTATLNTQLSSSDSQQVPRHNSLVDTLSAGSVVSYTSAFFVQQQQQQLQLQQQQKLQNETEQNDTNRNRSQSGIYVGTESIVEESTVTDTDNSEQTTQQLEEEQNNEESSTKNSPDPSVCEE